LDSAYKNWEMIFGEYLEIWEFRKLYGQLGDHFGRLVTSLILEIIFLETSRAVKVQEPGTRFRDYFEIWETIFEECLQIRDMVYKN